jgi:hypothetical protein
MFKGFSMKIAFFSLLLFAVFLISEVNGSTFSPSAETGCYKYSLNWQSGVLNFEQHSQNYLLREKGLCFDTVVLDFCQGNAENQWEKSSLADSSAENVKKKSVGKLQKTAAWMLLIGLIQNQFPK